MILLWKLGQLDWAGTDGLSLHLRFDEVVVFKSNRMQSEVCGMLSRCDCEF